MKKYSKLKLYSLIAFVLLLSVVFSGCTKAPFDIAKYVSITEYGYEEYGVFDVQLDYDALYKQFKPQLEKANISRELFPRFITVTYQPPESLMNGQVIDIQVELQHTDEENLEKITGKNLSTTITHTISTLVPVVDYDPFEDLRVSASGFHRTGTLYAHIEHYGENASWEWPVVVDESNGSLSNGDTVTLTLDVNKEEMERKYGIHILSMETTYQVDILVSYLESAEDLKFISEDNMKALNKVIEDWVISGDNDENPGNRTRTYEFEKAILLTKESDSRIFFIYHIEDGYVPSGYYVYISPNYSVLVDNQNKTLISGDRRPLSTSFAKYDKDTVRYTVKWEWGQDYERQGFMYRDVPYAGKATLEDMITYLTTWYDEYPTMHQLPD